MIEDSNKIRVSIYKPFPDLRLGCRIYCESKGVRDFQESNHIVFKGQKFNKIDFYNEVCRRHPELLKFTEVIFKVVSSKHFKDYIEQSYGNLKVISCKEPAKIDGEPEDIALLDNPYDKRFYVFWAKLDLEEIIELINRLKGSAFEIYANKIVEAIDRVTSKKIEKEGLKIFESILDYLNKK